MPLSRLRSRSFHGQDTVHGKGQTRGDGSGVVGTGVGGRVGGQGTARGHWCVRVGGQCRDLTVAEVQRGRPFVSARGCTPKGGPVNARRPHSQRGRGEGLVPGPRPPPLPGTFLAFLGRLLHGPGRAGRSGASHSPSRARPTAWNLGGGASLGPAPGAPRGAPPAAGGALPPAPPWTLESGVRQSGWAEASLRGPAQRPAPGGSHPLLQTLRRGVLEEAQRGDGRPGWHLTTSLQPRLRLRRVCTLCVVLNEKRPRAAGKKMSHRSGRNEFLSLTSPSSHAQSRERQICTGRLRQPSAGDTAADGRGRGRRLGTAGYKT